MRRRRLAQGTIQIIGLVVLLLTLTGCNEAGNSAIEFKATATQERVDPVQSPVPVAETELEGISEVGAEPDSSLGFVYKRGEAVGIRNGGQVPLGEDKVVEVFLSPYPPDWQTDLHLFLMDKETFQPLTDLEVELDYEMVFMDHGIDTQIGSKLEDGHYVLPLSFLMYGDWLVDATLQLPEGKKHLRFIVKFFP